MLGTSCYFNPPEKIEVIGRKLRGGSYQELSTQLMSDEALVGLYRNQVYELVATHLASSERMNEMESVWAPSLGYYAVPIAEAGFDPQIV